MKLKLKRKVTPEECFWLERDFEQGEEVFEFIGLTYNCISRRGIACSLDGETKTPFFELPNDALVRIQG